MKLIWNRRPLIFEPVALKFEGPKYENIFAQKNNKTLQETLAHRKYAKFKKEFIREYAEYLNWELGKFLFHLKTNADRFYLKFLNKYGDRKYSYFYIDDKKYLNRKGIYIYTNEEELLYIGRCRDSFNKRINQGYGRIHPKNCYIDGQATNCHLNSLVTENNQATRLFVYVMEDSHLIEVAESELIKRYSPKWNIALKSN